MTAPQARGAELTHRQIQVVFAGLMLGLLLAALDQTIVATALPTIVGDLGGLDHLSWIVTAYLLTSTAATPLFGKISDLYGRKRLFQVAIVTFVAGSVLSGAAQSMGQLVGFRALQGVGAGGLIAMAQVIVGDVVSPRARGRYMGYIGSMFALSSVAGPLLGGYFVDHLDWRWVFFVNVPVGALALVVTNSVLNLPFHRSERRVDVSGAALLVATVSCFVLVTSWGGTEHPWTSPVVVGLALAGVVFLAAFVARERRASEPILPLRLFRERTFVVASVVGFLVGAAMFGGIVFVPLFLQVVTGTSATGSGLLLMPMTLGIVGAATASGRLITRFGRYKVFPVAGTAVMTVGLALLSRLDTQTTPARSAAAMVVFGVGLGMVMQVLVLAVQNAAERRDLGIATSAASLFRSMGAAFGTALFGALLSSGLARWLPRLVPSLDAGALDVEVLQSSPERIASLPAPVRDGVAEAFARSIHVVFLVAVPLGIVAFLVALALRELPLRDRAHVGRDALDDAAAALEAPVSEQGVAS